MTQHETSGVVPVTVATDGRIEVQLAGVEIPPGYSMEVEMQMPPTDPPMAFYRVYPSPGWRAWCRRWRYGRR